MQKTFWSGGCQITGSRVLRGIGSFHMKSINAIAYLGIVETKSAEILRYYVSWAAQKLGSISFVSDLNACPNRLNH